MTGREFERRSDPYRHELLAHCYRLLGSTHEAETLLWEALHRAWHAYPRFDDRRAAMRTWLYGIATTTCLETPTARRHLPSGRSDPSDDPDQTLVLGDDVRWLEPFPDPTPRGDLRLAFVAALQLLPSHQRAVLLLHDIASLSAAEVADALDSTASAVNSTRRRARARMAELAPAPHPPAADPTALLDRYITAFEHADAAALGRLVTDDIVLELPPYRTWFAGRDHVVRFLTTHGTGRRLIPTAANGQPAVAIYARGPDHEYHAHAIAVFTMARNGISHAVECADPTLFAPFGLPLSIGQAQVG
ncbi:MAG TPA: RNA polymerase subunit sigma-70 [Pseudonocardiaceae bacterium]